MRVLARFAEDESGATAIEYALIAILISTAVVGAMGILGSSLPGLYQGVLPGFSK